MIWKWILQNLARMNLKVYFFFLVLTAFLWLMMKLSDSYSQNLELKLEFIDLPEAYAITHQSDSILKVSVSAEGFKILRISGNVGNTLELSLNDMNLLNHMDGSMSAEIKTALLQPLIKNQLGINISERDIEPSNISVDLDQIDTVYLPVRFTSKLKTKAGFRCYGEPKITPPMIELTGPRHILDTIRFIECKKIQPDELSENFSGQVKLVKPAPQLSMNTKEVEVDIQVVEFIQAESTIPVHVSSNIPKLKVRCFPPKVKVSYQIALPDYEQIEDSMFQIEVQIDSITALRKSSLIPVLKRKPDNIEDIRLSADKIDFIIINK
jgi:YbbR domain-containing protein